MWQDSSSVENKEWQAELLCGGQGLGNCMFPSVYQLVKLALPEVLEMPWTSYLEVTGTVLHLEPGCFYSWAECYPQEDLILELGIWEVKQNFSADES